METSFQSYDYHNNVPYKEVFSVTKAAYDTVPLTGSTEGILHQYEDNRGIETFGNEDGLYSTSLDNWDIKVEKENIDERSCSECGEMFSFCYSASTHVCNHHSNHQQHQPSNNTQHTCMLCKVSFLTYDDLMVHKCPTIQMMNDRVYTSDDSREGFSSSPRPPPPPPPPAEKQFTCDDCGKKFATSSHLKRHKRVHTGEKPYKCGDCGASFAHSYSLKRHEHIHTGEKPYSCSDCGASFSHSHNLKRHEQTHLQ